MATQTDRNAFKAGVFMLVSVGLIVAVIFGIKGIGRFIVPSQDRVARFKLTDDVGGLGPGDEVRIGGAKVGVVRSVDIEGPTGGGVGGGGVSGDSGEPVIVIAFTMPKRFVLRDGADVSVQSTVTAVSVLNFSSLGTGTALPDSQAIVGKTGGLTSLLASAGEIAPEVLGAIRDVRGATLPKVNTAIDSGNTLLRHVDTKVEPIVDRYNKVADSGVGALDQISSLFGDTKADFRGTIANLNSATAAVKEKLPAILDQTHGALTKVNTAIERTNESLLDIREVAANARDISASGRRIITGNRGKIDAMIAALRATGENLKNATAEIRRSPWRLLYKPAPNEMANLNLYDSARQFAEGANDLSDAAEALRDGLQSKPDDAKQVEVLLQKLDDSFAHFTEVEKQLWTQVKE